MAGGGQQALVEGVVFQAGKAQWSVVALHARFELIGQFEGATDLGLTGLHCDRRLQGSFSFCGSLHER
ncbi:hypothetical protein D3C79_969290 [compost metagenome]